MLPGLVLAVLAMLAGGCSPEKKENAPPVWTAVTGVAMYHQRVTMPAGTVLTVRVVETAASKTADSPVMGEQVVNDLRVLPARFQIPIDLNKIDEKGTYVVTVTVANGGKPLFVNRSIYPVLTRGYGSEVEILMEEAAP